MASKYDGLFSANLFSLQLQIKTLLEGAGGDQALELLDTLCTLNKSEQRVALQVFQRCLARVAESEQNLCSTEDRALKEFEEQLYQDIAQAMHEGSIRERPVAARRFEVLDGGKGENEAPIDLEKARKTRRLRPVPTLIN